MSGTSDEQFQKENDLARLREEQWRWAREQVVPWGELEEDDYNFRSWARGASVDLLNAGCLYEYARESHKYRCQLILSAAKPKRWRGIGTWTECERPTTWYIHLLLSGGDTWLSTFAAELARNLSFAELLRTSPIKVKESLEALPSYSGYPKAVGLPGRYIDFPGSQDVLIQFCWGHYNNDEIGKEMAILAKKLRPPEEPEPQRRGKEKSSEFESLLDALSAMRLASHYPKTLPLQPESPRRDRRKRPHGAATAVSKFKNNRLGGIPPGSTKRKILGEVGHNEFDRYAARGRQQFKDMFPFGETAANGLTWAQRQRKRE